MYVSICALELRIDASLGGCILRELPTIRRGLASPDSTETSRNLMIRCALISGIAGHCETGEIWRCRAMWRWYCASQEATKAAGNLWSINSLRINGFLLWYPIYKPFILLQKWFLDTWNLILLDNWDSFNKYTRNYIYCWKNINFCNVLIGNRYLLCNCFHVI